MPGFLILAHWAHDSAIYCDKKKKKLEMNRFEWMGIMNLS